MSKLAVVLFFISAVVAVGQVGPDQPYMLVYRGPVCPSPFVYSGSLVNSSSTEQLYWSQLQNCPLQTQIEYFPTLEKALDRMNSRSWIYSGTSGQLIGETLPALTNDNLIGLFKVQRLPAQIRASGKKMKVTRQIPQEFEEDVLEWQVQP